MRRLAAVSFLGLAPRSASAFAFPRLCSPVAAGPWLQRAHAHPLCSAAWSSMTVVELKAALKKLKPAGAGADADEAVSGKLGALLQQHARDGGVLQGGAPGGGSSAAAAAASGSEKRKGEGGATPGSEKKKK